MSPPTTVTQSSMTYDPVKVDVGLGIDWQVARAFGFVARR